MACLPLFDNFPTRGKELQRLVPTYRNVAAGLPFDVSKSHIFSFQFSMPRDQKKCITHRRNPHTELQAIFCNFKLSFWIWFESVECLAHLCQSFNLLFAKSRMGFQSHSVDCIDSLKKFYHFTHIKEI